LLLKRVDTYNGKKRKKFFLVFTLAASIFDNREMLDVYNMSRYIWMQSVFVSIERMAWDLVLSDMNM
jgi:hypothetical protein